MVPHQRAAPPGQAPSLPTLVRGRDLLPRRCADCGSALLSAEEPMGQHARGQIACGLCGRQLCWLGAPMAEPRRVEPRDAPLRGAPFQGGNIGAADVIGAASVPPAPTPAPTPASLASPPAWWLPACSAACRRERIMVAGSRSGFEWREYHDPEAHERLAVSASLILAVALSARPLDDAAVCTGPLVVNTRTGRLFVGGRERHLTPIEFDLLAHLARHLGRFCPRYELAAAIWSDDLWRRNRNEPIVMSDDPAHALRVHLTRLRPKLGPARHLIENRPGVGYMLRAEPPC